MNSFLQKDHYTSINLWKEINLLTAEQIEVFSKGLKWTTENLPDPVILGGTAVVHYLNRPRKLTPDLDFLVPSIDFVKSKLRDEKLTSKHLDDSFGNFLGYTVPELNTDFLDGNTGNIKLNKLILNTPHIITIGGYKVKVIPPELLSILKLELGRDKDITDGFALLSSGTCDTDNYMSYIALLGNTLQDYDSIAGYQKFIQ